MDPDLLEDVTDYLGDADAALVRATIGHRPPRISSPLQLVVSACYSQNVWVIRQMVYRLTHTNQVGFLILVTHAIAHSGTTAGHAMYSWCLHGLPLILISMDVISLMHVETLVAESLRPLAYEIGLRTIQEGTILPIIELLRLNLLSHVQMPLAIAAARYKRLDICQLLVDDGQLYQLDQLMGSTDGLSILSAVDASESTLHDLFITAARKGYDRAISLIGAILTEMGRFTSHIRSEAYDVVRSEPTLTGWCQGRIDRALSKLVVP